MNRAFLAVGADFPGTHSTWHLTHICKSPHHDGALPKSVLTQGWCTGRWQIWVEPSTQTWRQPNSSSGALSNVRPNLS